MGNTSSSLQSNEEVDIWWSNTNINMENNPIEQAEARSSNQLSAENAEKLNEFKLELARKHEKRREILDEKRKEMQDLRKEVASLRKENQQLKLNPSESSHSSSDESTFEIERLRKENEDLKQMLEEKQNEVTLNQSLSEKNNDLRISMAEMQTELQNLNSEVLDFEKEREEYQTHVVALKDVITVSKQMLQIREAQLKELKEKVDSIEETLAGREMNILSQDLRNEYERQLQNIRNLKALYEERQRTDKKEKEELAAQLEDAKKELEAEQTKQSELASRITELEESNSNKYDEIKSLESNMGFAKAESRQYQAELTVINQLFSEILLGFNNSQDLDLDTLTKTLEDHHDLLQNIVVNEISTVSSALPKVLLDLVTQVKCKETENDGESHKLETIEEETESQTSSIHQMNSAEEIVENLPKVWRVLIELLSHQKAPLNVLTEPEVKNDENPCYKVVETPKGPSLVLSVSQTFIRLKDLILEKKSLEKETSNLKQLNTHLETRLQDQESRLAMVSTELSKTWHVVGKLQKQHQMLHTQEKILRYELAQKRKLLTELKEELEYSREKWQQAREKNSTTEKQWRQLRTEFASRRAVVTEDLNNSSSVESGYSDERASSDDEPGYETDVSEGNQKVSSAEENETKPDASNIIQEEAKEIVSEVALDPTTNDLELVQAGSSREDFHSTLEHSKTDLVTNSEKTDLNSTNSLEDKETAQVKTSQDSTKIEVLEERLSSNSNVDDTEEKSSQVKVLEQKIIEEPPPKASSSELSGEESAKNFETQPSTSQNAAEKHTRTLEEVLAARDERLKRLEGECQQLVAQVTNTSNKSVVMSNKLDNLHEVYGESSNSAVDNDNTEVPSSSLDNVVLESHNSGEDANQE